VLHDARLFWPRHALKMHQNVNEVYSGRICGKRIYIGTTLMLEQGSDQACGTLMT